MKKKKRSHGEEIIEKILFENGINYQREYIFNDLKTMTGIPLRFDFACFDEDNELMFLIEFQGIQHYKPCDFFGGYKTFNKQKYNDNRKRTYCRFNNIQLLEIPYTDTDILDYDYIFSKVDI